MLRDYQVDAIAAARGYLSICDGNPLIECATGGGKSHISAELAAGWANQGLRTLVLSDRKELLEQTGDKLGKAHPNLPFGYFSASLGRKEAEHPITIAGIQSVYRHAKKFSPPIARVIVDECDLVPFSTSSMYQRLFAELREAGPIRIVGMTATPFRLDSGPLCAPGTKGNVFDHIVYRIGAGDLIQMGHLATPRTKAVRNAVDDSLLRIQQGEFREEDYNAAMGDAQLTNAMSEALRLLESRHSILIFASGVTHATRIVDHLKAVGVAGVALITGNTDMEERANVVADFRAGTLRILVNVGVFLRGFDAPNVDGIVLMRATMSAACYVQMVGRGFRPHESKEGGTFTVLDYGKNIQRHGPIDDLSIGQKPRRGEPSKVKECPSCGEQVALKFTACPCCGAEFPKKSRGGPELDEQADDKDILGRRSNAPRTMDVAWVRYQVIEARNGKPPILRVEYNPQGGGIAVSEFVCFAHVGFARNKAVEWWNKRSPIPPCPTCPTIMREAVKHIARPTRITVYREMDRYGKPTPYERVVVDPKDLVPPKARVEADTLFAGGDPYSAR